MDVAERNREIIRKTREGGGRRPPPLDILFSARGNLFTQPGGDTEVAVCLKSALTSRGYEVGFHAGPQNGIRCRLTHIFNPEPSSALHSLAAGRPYVLTPMYEDMNRYQPLSWEIVGLFQDYLENGDGDAIRRWSETVGDDSGNRGGPPDYGHIFGNAEAIFASGGEEGRRIVRDYPAARNVVIARLGFGKPREPGNVSPELFHSEYGVRDFVLCVGRLENRKNQLMLLEALRDDDIPLVFVNSDTVQPEYEALCKRFHRRGKTLFTGRIPREMLHSAYKAAKVHALPSWYELPGLVTLEAAWFGCNVVASDRGTVRDYLGERVFYCSPHDPVSIRRAVHRAVVATADPACRTLLEGYTWERTANSIASTYESLFAKMTTPKWRNRFRQKMASGAREGAFLGARVDALNLVRENPAKAIEYTSILLEFRKDDPITQYIRGTALLLAGRFADAESCLKHALALMPYFDIKCYLHLSLALSMQKKYGESVSVLGAARKIHPFLPRETKALIHEYLSRAYSGAGDPAMGSRYRTGAHAGLPPASV